MTDFFYTSLSKRIFVIGLKMYKVEERDPCVMVQHIWNRWRQKIIAEKGRKRSWALSKDSFALVSAQRTPPACQAILAILSPPRINLKKLALFEEKK